MGRTRVNERAGFHGQRGSPRAWKNARDAFPISVRSPRLPARMEEREYLRHPLDDREDQPPPVPVREQPPAAARLPHSGPAAGAGSGAGEGGGAAAGITSASGMMNQTVA